jgi:hypothetical protein
MSGGMAMFQSELRSAVREARETPGSPNETRQAPRLAKSSSSRGEVTDAFPRPPRVSEKRTVVKLWLPLTPLWVLLAPFALLLAPLLMFVPQMLPDRPRRRAVRATFGLPDKPRGRALRAALAVHPYRTAFALGAVLFALSGTSVDVDTPDAVVRIRIF